MTFEQTRRERLETLCDRKRHYDTKREAREHAATLRKKFGNALFVYKCPVCKHWLLTTQPQSASDIVKAGRGQRAPLAEPHPSRRTT